MEECDAEASQDDSTDYSDTEDDESVISSSKRVTRTSASSLSNLSGKRKKSSRNDSPDYGLKNLFKTPEDIKHSADENPLNFSGMKELFRTPAVAESVDYSDTEDDESVINSSKRVTRTSTNNLSNLSGMRKKSSRNDSPDYGLKNLFKTPEDIKHSANDNPLNFSGMEELFKTAAVAESSQTDLVDCSDTEDDESISSKRITRTSTNNLSNLSGMERMFKTPNPSKSSRNDTLDSGLKTPKFKNLSNLSGMKEIFKTPSVAESSQTDLMDCIDTEDDESVSNTTSSDLLGPGEITQMFKTSSHRRSSRTPKVVEFSAGGLTYLIRSGMGQMLKTSCVAESSQTDLVDYSDTEDDESVIISPKRVSEAADNDLLTPSEITQMFKTPKYSKSSDQSNVEGIGLKTSSRTSKVIKSSTDGLSDLSGVEQFTTPSITKSSTTELTDYIDTEDDESHINRSKRVKRASASDLLTPSEITQMFKTPKQSKSSDRSNTEGIGLRTSSRTPKVVKSSTNGLSNLSGVEQLFLTPSVTKSSQTDLTDYIDTEDDESLINRSKRVTRASTSDLLTPSEITQMFKTPNRPKSSDQSNAEDIGFRRPSGTPKVVKSSADGLSDLGGVEQLFTTPSVTKSSLTDYIDTEDDDSLINRFKRVARASTSDLLTPSEITQMFKTPKQSKSSDRSNTEGIGLRTPSRTPKVADGLSDLGGVEQLFTTPSITKSSTTELTDYIDTEDDESVRNRSKRISKTSTSDLLTPSEITQMFKTSNPPRSSRKDSFGRGNAEDNLRSGLKRLFKTPKMVKSSTDDSVSNLSGMEQIFKTPDVAKEADVTKCTDTEDNESVSSKSVSKTSANDLLSPSEITQMFKAAKSLSNDSPRHDNAKGNLRSGLKRLFKTPKTAKSSTDDSLSNISGMGQMFKTPNATNLSDVDATEEDASSSGIEEFSNQSTSKAKSGCKTSVVNKSPNLSFVKKIFKTPSVQESTKSDTEKVLKIPKSKKPQHDGSLSGVKALFATPKAIDQNESETKAKRKLPTKKRKSIEVVVDALTANLNNLPEDIVEFPSEYILAKRKKQNISRVSELSSNDNNTGTSDPEDAFTAIFNRKPVRTYRGKSCSPIKLQKSPIRSNVISPTVITPDTVSWVQNVNQQWNPTDKNNEDQVTCTVSEDTKSTGSLLKENVMSTSKLISKTKRGSNQKQIKENISPEYKNNKTVSVLACDLRRSARNSQRNTWYSDEDYICDVDVLNLTVSEAPAENVKIISKDKETKKLIQEEDDVKKGTELKNTRKTVEARSCMSEKLPQKRIRQRNTRYSSEYFISDFDKRPRASRKLTLHKKEDKIVSDESNRETLTTSTTEIIEQPLNTTTVEIATQECQEANKSVEDDQVEDFIANFDDFIINKYSSLSKIEDSSVKDSVVADSSSYQENINVQNYEPDISSTDSVFVNKSISLTHLDKSIGSAQLENSNVNVPQTSYTNLNQTEDSGVVDNSSPKKRTSPRKAAKIDKLEAVEANLSHDTESSGVDNSSPKTASKQEISKANLNLTESSVNSSGRKRGRPKADKPEALNANLSQSETLEMDHSGMNSSIKSGQPTIATKTKAAEASPTKLQQTKTFKSDLTVINNSPAKKLDQLIEDMKTNELKTPNAKLNQTDSFAVDNSVTKRRGRPRKTIESDGTLESPDLDSIEGSAKKLDQQSKINETEEPNIPDAKLNQLDSPAVDNSVAKRRGRSRKTIEVDGKLVSPIANSSKESSQQSKIKKTGRLKTPVTKLNQTDSSTTDSSLIKKRGRPRKTIKSDGTLESPEVNLDSIEGSAKKLDQQSKINKTKEPNIPDAKLNQLDSLAVDNSVAKRQGRSRKTIEDDGKLASPNANSRKEPDQSRKVTPRVYLYRLRTSFINRLTVRNDLLARKHDDQLRKNNEPYELENLVQADNNKTYGKKQSRYNQKQSTIKVEKRVHFADEDNLKNNRTLLTRTSKHTEDVGHKTSGRKRKSDEMDMKPMSKRLCHESLENENIPDSSNDDSSHSVNKRSRCLMKNEPVENKRPRRGQKNNIVEKKIEKSNVQNQRLLHGKSQNSEADVFENKKPRRGQKNDLVEDEIEESNQRPRRGIPQNAVNKETDVFKNKRLRRGQKNDIVKEEIEESNVQNQRLLHGKSQNTEAHLSENKRPRRGQKNDLVKEEIGELNQRPQRGKPQNAENKETDVFRNNRPHRGQEDDIVKEVIEESNVQNQRSQRRKAQDNGKDEHTLNKDENKRPRRGQKNDIVKEETQELNVVRNLRLRRGKAQDSTVDKGDEDKPQTRITRSAVEKVKKEETRALRPRR
ncbi:hypothetical protein ILUMI_07037 [Ignelater luminosus]|uniref:Uncharacterized protein n=1 Tax=Ignelater luminosus TaxID=2038154 RepID=A0A8K0GIF3_IGNLU|nr:hypothetical protein ILUMI_07037 [Ignelater luminosus]